MSDEAKTWAPNKHTFYSSAILYYYSNYQIFI